MKNCANEDVIVTSKSVLKLLLKLVISKSLVNISMFLSITIDTRSRDEAQVTISEVTRNAGADYTFVRELMTNSMIFIFYSRNCYLKV